MTGFTEFISDIAGWLFITSLKAIIVIALVMIIRLVFSNRLPAKWRYGLWLLLIVRLILPLELSSAFSIFNFHFSAKNEKTHYVQYQDIYRQENEKNTAENAMQALPVQLPSLLQITINLPFGIFSPSFG